MAAVVIPLTILTHFTAEKTLSTAWMAGIILAAELSIAGLLVAIRLLPLRRTYHVAFFLLVGVICSGIEALLLQLTGGGRGSDFFYPYFLIMFGIATLFPARFGWAVAAALMCPISYLASELVVWGGVAEGPAARNLILLIEVAMICIAANLVTTRTYFNELEHRRAVETANEQLLELDKAKRDFFANLSHDLKTPLNLIIGPVQSVEQGAEALDDRSRRYLNLALRGARRLDSMINDLLELARIEAGVVKLNRQRVDLVQLVGGFVEAAGAYATSVGQNVEFLSSGGDCIAEVDPDKLERVVGNLVSNAIKFSAPGSTVSVALSQTDDQVKISVTDQGPGIAPEEQRQIFSRFARGSDATKKRTRGAGVGLAVVKEFVDLHKGTVSITSALGHGSTFTVTLPKRGEVAVGEPTVVTQQPAPEHRKFAAPAVNRARPRMLLVEDDDEMRVFLSAELGRNLEIIAVADGEAALQFAIEQPDIVLMDVMLPGMSGIETVQRLRRHPSTANIPILVYSARGDLQTRLQSFEAGADDFVHKPVDPLELRARVDSLLRRAGSDGAATVTTTTAPAAT